MAVKMTGQLIQMSNTLSLAAYSSIFTRPLRSSFLLVLSSGPCSSVPPSHRLQHHGLLSSKELLAPSPLPEKCPSLTFTCSCALPPQPRQQDTKPCSPTFLPSLPSRPHRAPSIAYNACCTSFLLAFALAQHSASLSSIKENTAKEVLPVHVVAFILTEMADQSLASPSRWSTGLPIRTRS